MKDDKIKNLEVEIAALKHDQDRLEQYTRRTSLRISGPPKGNNENVCAKVLDLCNKIIAYPCWTQRDRTCKSARSTRRESTADTGQVRYIWHQGIGVQGESCSPPRGTASARTVDAGWCSWPGASAWRHWSAICRRSDRQYCNQWRRRRQRFWRRHRLFQGLYFGGLDTRQTINVLEGQTGEEKQENTWLFDNWWTDYSTGQ